MPSSPGLSRIAHTKANILKTKQHLSQKRVSTTRLLAEMKISASNMHRIFCEGLGRFAYRKVKQPRLMDL